MRNYIVILFFFVFLSSCIGASKVATSDTQVPIYGYTIKSTHPHNTGSYTQGLLWQDSLFIESTGQYGESKLMRIKLGQTTAGKQIKLDDKYFGEGITQLKGKIYQLTWMENTMFIYDAKSLELLEQISYPGQGWGLANDGTYIYMSDGSNQIQVLNPEDWTMKRVIEVTNNGNQLNLINEMEWINGELWANVYLTDMIVRIDPSSGNVVGIIDLKGILDKDQRTSHTDVLNGIAYDRNNNRIFVTGKYWSQLFEIEIHKK